MHRRHTILICLLLLVGGACADQKKPVEKSATRHGIAVDLKAFPQGTAKETFASVLKAIENKKIDYLLAQLTDPAFVDERVQRLFAGKFEQQVAETQAKLDAAAVSKLKKFEAKGEWSAENSRAVVRLKEVPERVVQFKKLGQRLVS